MARTLYYDSALGDDAAAGTIQQPRRTLAQATTDAAADSTTVVKLKADQTFKGSVLTVTGAGSVVIESYGDGPGALIDGENARACISLVGAAGVTVRGIRLTNGSGQDLVSGSGALANVLLTDLTMNGGRYAFNFTATGAATTNVIERCTLRGQAKDALLFAPTAGAGFTFRKSRLDNVGLVSTANYDGCVAHMGPGSDGSVVLEEIVAIGVRNGFVGRNTNVGSSAVRRCFFVVQDGAGGAAPGGGVIKVAAATPGSKVLVENCIFVIEGALANLGLVADLRGEVEAYNCTIANFQATGGTLAVLASTPGELGQLMLKSCISYLGTAATLHTLSLGTYVGEKNLFWNTTGGSVRFQGGTQDLDQWRSATSQDVESSEDDPKFAVAGGHNALDYLPAIDGPATGNGDPLLSVDYLGVARLAAEPSLGAFQARRGAGILFIALGDEDVEEALFGEAPAQPLDQSEF